jgi:CheY-like chemotaxis protein
VVDTLRGLAARKELRVDSNVDAGIGPLLIDPARIKQVLYNYLSNAIKFTPAGGRISVRGTPEGADFVRIEVEDTGVGIAPGDFAKLFVEFQQLDASAAKRYQGTGLGLALTRRITEAHGGWVEVRSTRGCGSTFCSIVPRRLGEISSGAREPAFSDRWSAMLLVIDGNPAVRRWLADQFRELSHRVELAAPQEAVAICERRAFDAIVLDPLVPELRRCDVVQRIRASELNRNVPLFAVATSAERQRSQGFPLQDFLIKPVREELLESSLSRALGAGQNQTVLVVDDDETCLRMIEPVLARMGCNAICTRGAEAGLRVVQERPPGAIVLDLVMSEVDGFEFLERLRQLPAAHDIPVVIWTAKDLSPEEESSLRRSATAIVAKANDGPRAITERLRGMFVDRHVC